MATLREFAPREEPAVPLALDHLRRCTFRRVMAVGGRSLPLYDVECLYPSRSAPVPLGDLATARPICESCRAVGIFRADED